jgi:hypothetical protein
MIPVVVEETATSRATVRLPGGRRGDAPTNGRTFAAGDEALLMVRPERLEIEAGEPPEGRVGLPVTCTDLVFQGAVVRCALRDAAGDELVIYLAESEQKPEVRPGAELWLRWRPDAARLLHVETAP